VVAASLAWLPLVALADVPATDAAAVKVTDEAAARVERGRYLVTTSGCHDCHTPLRPGTDERDMSRMLSGHPETLVMPPLTAPPALPWETVASTTFTAWRGPWGVSFTANLTPDPETGLGRWTLQNFKDTIRTGRHMGRGRPVLPPMPIPMYKHFNDEDLSAIFAYLQSIPAVKNRVPEPLSPPVVPLGAQ
jgi:mono/diheme cytochrome c family protein